MKFNDKKAWKEAISDCIIGTILNFPLNMLAITVIFEMDLSVFESSVLLWFMFTVVAVFRKYMVRVYFKKKRVEGS